jgi:glycosyltransferase involved in cell wall biosynthesis
MRILVLNWRDPRNPEAGGAEVHLHEIMKRTVSAGHEVVQVSQAVEGLPPEEEIDGLRVLRHGRRNTFNLTLKPFCKKLGLKSFDLIVEDLCKLPFYSPRWSDTPVLVIVPHLFGTTAYREVALPLALYVNLLEKLIPRVYGGCRFVAISESTRNDLVRRGIPQKDIDVVPCGIDTDVYSPGPSRPVPGTILYVGRIKRYKGIQYALRAVDILRKRGVECRMTVLGSGDYLGKLRRASEDLGLDDLVSFEGFVPEEDKLRWLRESWVAVFPSEKEGWGLTVIEANACGTPVVASDSEGLRDSVRNGKTGLLVPHGDPGELADALQRILQSPELRSSLSDNALRWAKSFDWESTASRMIEIMEKSASAGS